MVTGLIIFIFILIYSRYRDYKFKIQTIREINKLNDDNEFLYCELLKVNHILEVEPKDDTSQEVMEEIRQAMMN